MAISSSTVTLMATTSVGDTDDTIVLTEIDVLARGNIDMCLQMQDALRFPSSLFRVDLHRRLIF